MNGRYLIAALAPCCVLLFAGCGSGNTITTPDPTPTSTVLLQGTVYAGSTPVAGASVRLYATGLGGNKTAATPLATTAITDASGAFSISTSSTVCPSATTQVYAVAAGGTVGSASSNSALKMMAAWGNCGALNDSVRVKINEVTTAAAAWALAPFAADTQSIAASASNGSGLANSMQIARLLADASNGTSPSSALAAGSAIQSAKLYSLANILASCTVSGGSACTQIFALCASGSEAPPGNTADAAIRIVQNPARNVVALYALAASTYSGLASAPSDWTMTMTVSGLNSPTGIAIDAQGRAWIANYPGSITAFDAAGAPLFPSPISGGGLAQIYAVAVDPSGNIWATTFSGNAVVELSSSGAILSGASGFTGGGLRSPDAIRSTAAGNLWIANYGNSTVTQLNSTGTAISPSSGYAAGASISFPSALTLDSAGTPWIANQSGSIVHLDSSGNVQQLVNCCLNPSGIAMGLDGSIWVTDYLANALVHVSSSGVVLGSTSAGGINFPNGAAIDSAGRVWVANYHGNSVSLLEAADSSTITALSPSAGFEAGAQLNLPYAVAIDASGSVWITSYGNNRVVRLIGTATPVRTPFYGVPVAP